MVTPRGRGATPVRPGLVTKGVLLGQIPLATGELVTEAAINDLHSSYKELIKRENALRPKARRLRGMTAQSFKTLFKFAQLLNLVELVREEPALFPPPGGPLYSIRKPDGVHVVVSTRRVFKLTAVGKEDERSWSNLCRAWREGWSAPEKIEYAPPYVPPPKPPVVPPVEVPEVFVPYKWMPTPSTARFKTLLAHLETMGAIGAAEPEIAAEIDRLSMLVSDWVMEIGDALDDARAINNVRAIRRLEPQFKSITALTEALMDGDLRRAIASLRKLVG